MIPCYLPFSSEVIVPPMGVWLACTHHLDTCPKGAKYALSEIFPVDAVDCCDILPDISQSLHRDLPLPALRVILRFTRQYSLQARLWQDPQRLQSDCLHFVQCQTVEPSDAGWPVLCGLALAPQPVPACRVAAFYPSFSSPCPTVRLARLAVPPCLSAC